jgi:hypothetical protein
VSKRAIFVESISRMQVLQFLRANFHTTDSHWLNVNIGSQSAKTKPKNIVWSPLEEIQPYKTWLVLVIFLIIILNKK